MHEMIANFIAPFDGNHARKRAADEIARLSDSQLPKHATFENMLFQETCLD
jgi:hypothetical protein